MRERETFRRLLRDAADPGLAPGAAGRIADGAWARAAELRRAGTASPVRSGRFAWRIAAAAAVLAGAVIAVRSSTPAFAVEGDPVQVLDGNHWDDAKRVRPGAWVFVPPGTRTIRARDGSQIAPQPGAVFRLVSAPADGRTWRVEMRRGDADVAGSTFVLEVSDQMEVARAENGPLRVRVSLGDAVATPPARIDGMPATSMPLVRVLDGAARVSNLRSAQFLMVRADESVASVVVDDSATARPQIVRTVAWNPQVALDVARGANLLNCAPRPDGIAFLNIARPGGDVQTISIPVGLQDEALSHLTLLAAENAARSISISVERRDLGAAGWRQYEAVRDGAHTRITVREDGTAVLERTGADAREFPSLDDLRHAAPDAAAPFGDRLR
jgi:hypothetical protein